MSITGEINDYIASSSFKEIFSVFDPIGDTSSKIKEKMKNWIFNATADNQSHAITGLYTIGNISTRPYKYYVMLGSFETGGILLNVDPDRSWVIAVPYNAKVVHIKEFKALLRHLSTVFLFISGKRYINLVDLNNETIFEREMKNNVYKLKEFDSEVHQGIHAGVNVIIHPSTQENFMKVKQFYGYKEEKMEELRYTQVILEYQDELVASIRSNEEVDNNVVIGGVSTIITRRNQKFGYTACYHYLKHILQNFDNVFLETDVDNFPAIKIYEKLGFEQVGHSAFFEKGMEMIKTIIGDRDY